MHVYRGDYITTYQNPEEIRELKECEGCVGVFVRRVDSTVKFCPHCRATQLLSDLSESFRALWPEPAKKRLRLPVYDEVRDGLVN